MAIAEAAAHGHAVDLLSVPYSLTAHLNRGRGRGRGRGRARGLG